MNIVLVSASRRLLIKSVSKTSTTLIPSSSTTSLIMSPPADSYSPGSLGSNKDLVASGVLSTGGDSGASAVVAEFPEWALQPKRETGARNFLSKNPDYDGRGTIIAIFDSGVDPGAGGMQVTTDGKRKVIDRIDASGAGDVDTSKIVELKDGKLTGATGRVLTLPTDCQGFVQYRVGFKRAFSLYPKNVRDRVIKERQEKQWDPEHKLKLADITRKVVEMRSSEEENVVGLAKLAKENIECEQEMLNTIDKKFKEDQGDLGPIYDVVLFHNGETWVVLIDTSECGDLGKGLRLRPYRETGDFAPLTPLDRVNVSVNVYDDGDIVQIVSMCSAHGTHVASIAAAHFPDEPEKNGLAPGAQIVSISIGDGRLSSMETGTALVRAMVHVMQATHYKIDVINMSYGEHSHWSNTGRIGQLMSEVVNKHGVIWVASAGNDGPALCTVGTPPDISTNSIIGVGAYVSPEMMVAMYSTREKLPGTPYTWTSRGPTIDGDRGVTVCAPGGAITSVPHFTLRGTQLMNGTSMASPHVCGGVALLLSGLKQLGIPYSPFSMKRALANSALPLPRNCHFAQGHGLFQIDAAFEYLCNFSTSDDVYVRYAVSCGSDGAKGIHLRDVKDLSKKQEIAVKVEPFFLDNDNADPDRKINFNMKFALTTTASWIHCPDHLNLMFTARHFVVSVDPTVLDSGANVGYIKAFDVSQPQRGHVFEIPVTAIQPEPIVAEPRPHVVHKNISFTPGLIKRTFVNVPDGASYAVLRVQSHETSNSGKFILHTVQLEPKRVVRTWEYLKMLSINELGEFIYSFPVKDNNILEVCLAKWWANIGTVEVTFSVTFHGISLNTKEVFLHGAECFTRVDILSPLHQEEAQPEIRLKNLVQNYRPNESKVLPLRSRDVIPPNRQIYELQASYSFNMSKAGEITVNFPWLSDVLYESEFESQLWLLYNSHKQVVASGDAFPSKWPAKIEKEEYVLKVHVRSESKDVLEKLSDMPMLLGTKLASSVNIDIYTSFAAASTCGKKCNSLSLLKGSQTPIYIAAINGEKFMKNATQGQYLSGTMTLSKDDLGRKVDAIKVKYVLPEAPKKDKSTGKNNKGKTEPTYREALTDFQISWLGKLDPNSNESEELFNELQKDSKVTNQIQVALARVSALQVDKLFNKTELEEDDKNRLEKTIEICDSVLKKIDVSAILSHNGSKHDSSPNAAEIKKDIDKQKNWYLEASNKKGISHCLLHQVEAANEVALNVMRLVDLADSKIIAFSVMHAELLGHFGRALKLANAQLDQKPGSIDIERTILRLYRKLEWNHALTMGEKSLELRYPPSYELF